MIRHTSRNRKYTAKTQEMKKICGTELSVPVPACSWWRQCWIGYRQQTVQHYAAEDECYAQWCQCQPDLPVTWTYSNTLYSWCSTPLLSHLNLL